MGLIKCSIEDAATYKRNGVDCCPFASRLFFVRKRARKTSVLKRETSALKTFIPFAAIDWVIKTTLSIQAFGTRRIQSVNDVLADCSPSHELRS